MDQWRSIGVEWGVNDEIKKILHLVQQPEFAILGKLFSSGTLKGFENSLGVDDQKSVPTHNFWSRSGRAYKGIWYSCL